MSARDHIDAASSPLTLESLPAAEQAVVREHVADCPRCAKVLADSAEALAAVALALRDIEPPAQLKSRVLETAARTSRFERFAEESARIADLAVAEMRELLRRIDEATSWEDSPLPGVSLYHLDGGPRRVNSILGFTRIKPGAFFPDHEHVGEEEALILQGSAVDGDGRVLKRGDFLPMEGGTSHKLTALPGPDFIYISASEGGFKVFGEHILPGDPRT